MQKKSKKAKFGLYLAVAVVLIFVLFPVYYMVSVSFRTQSSMFMNPSF